MTNFKWIRTRTSAVVLTGAVVILATAGGIVASKNQSVALDLPMTSSYGEGPFRVVGSASSALPVTVELMGGPCVLNGATAVAAGVGTCVFAATQRGDGWRNPVTITSSVTISKGDPRLSISAPSAATFGDSPLSISATGRTSLPITLSASGPCRLDGGRLAIAGAGACTVHAAQSGDENYSAASTDVTVSIAKASQTISFPDTPAAAVYGGGPFSVAARATSGLAVTFSAAGACSASGSTVTIRAAGMCTVTATQPGDGNWLSASPVARSVPVAKSDQQITLRLPGTLRYGGGSVSVDATSTSPLAVSATASGACTTSRGALAAKGFIGTDICTISATQAGDSNFNPAQPVIQRVTVVGLSWSCCRLIFSPPPDFCLYFGCIGNFGNSAGYVIQCADGLFSTAGGIRGSCSGHGGNARAIYMP